MNKPAVQSSEAHPAAVAAMGAWVVVTVAGKVIACTAKALILDESSRGPTLYFPRDDVDMALLRRSSHVIHDPEKGDRVYYSIPTGGTRSEDAAWSYEKPHPAIAAIRDYLAFAPARVDAIVEWPGD